MKESIKLVARNKKAGFDYELFDKLEAGLALQGSEVKSLREGKVSLNEAYARIRNGAAWVLNMDIAPYPNAGLQNHEPKRPRKLLLHEREVERLIGKTKERGFTLIPLSLYFKNGWAKLEIALARGRKKYDKREKIKEREMSRELRKRMMK